jgi:hypothetical protein
MSSVCQWPPKVMRTKCSVCHSSAHTRCDSEPMNTLGVLGASATASIKPSDLAARGSQWKSWAQHKADVGGSWGGWIIRGRGRWDATNPPSPLEETRQEKSLWTRLIGVCPVGLTTWVWVIERWWQKEILIWCAEKICKTWGSGGLPKAHHKQNAADRTLIGDLGLSGRKYSPHFIRAAFAEVWG